MGILARPNYVIFKTDEDTDYEGEEFTIVGIVQGYGGNVTDINLDDKIHVMPYYDHPIRGHEDLYTVHIDNVVGVEVEDFEEENNNE